MTLDTAILTSDDRYTSFIYGDRTIRFATSPHLQRYEKVLTWDKGYLVVTAKYANSSQTEEEYIDLIPILENLYIQPNTFLKNIKKVRIAYDKKHQTNC